MFPHDLFSITHVETLTILCTRCSKRDSTVKLISIADGTITRTALDASSGNTGGVSTTKYWWGEYH